MHFELPRPDHRFRAIRDAVKAGTFTTDDAVAYAIGQVLQGNYAVPEEVLYACRVYHDSYKREVLEAFLLAGADPAHVERLLYIPQPVTEIYSTYFFSDDAFVDRLDIESYVRRYPKDHDNGYGHKVKTFALELGLHYLSALYGRGDYEVPASAALNEMVSQAYLMSRVRQGVALDANTTKEARQWALTMISSLRTLPEVVKSSERDPKDLTIRLMMVKQRDGHDAIDPADIVHAHDVKEET